MLWAAAVTHSFKLVLAINFHVANHQGQHLLMDVNSRYPVRHKVPPGGSGERAANSLTRVTGYRRSHRREQTTPNYLLNHARSGSDTRTASTSPVRTQSHRSEPVLFCIRLELIFMRFCGPQAQTDTRDSPEISMAESKSPT